MYILYFSQAEIAERKVRRKLAREKKAEIIPDPDFRLIIGMSSSIPRATQNYTIQC